MHDQHDERDKFDRVSTGAGGTPGGGFAPPGTVPTITRRTQNSSLDNQATAQDPDPGGECRQVKQRKTRKRKSKRSREGDGEGEAEQDEDEDEEEHRGARSGESEELAELEGRAPAPSGSKPSLRTTSYHPRSRAQRPAKATTHPMTSTDTVVPRIMTSTHTQLIAAPAQRPTIPSPRHAPASRHAALTALPTSTSVTCNPGRWTA
mmetsp:Transcript_54485/g.145447  ORF Transcript_54485/g.145447 Transcript_54485/m.145447 type:complete len:206 (+) Transcript_54485:632-1249(+)